MQQVVGLTKDVGFQFGLQKTFPYAFETIWEFMFEGKGLDIWLGKLKGQLEVKKTFSTEDGVEGSVRVFRHHSHVRMNWKKKSWKNMSTVQVRVIGKGDKPELCIRVT